jgi:cold shock CspA family protein
MNKNWSNGSISVYDPKKETGVIRTFDGEEVVFHLSDVVGTTVESKKEALDPVVGQSVVFRFDKTEYGLQASEITLLNVSQDMSKYI